MDVNDVDWMVFPLWRFILKDDTGGGYSVCILGSEYRLNRGFGGPRAVCVDARSAVVWELLGCFIHPGNPRGNRRIAGGQPLWGVLHSQFKDTIERTCCFDHVDFSGRRVGEELWVRDGSMLVSFKSNRRFAVVRNCPERDCNSFHAVAVNTDDGPWHN